jgi:hypothetical protein
MAHFAKLDENNIVLEVLVVNNEAIDNLSFPESEPIGVEFCKSLYGIDTIWKQTSYNGSFRKHYAGKGYTYMSDIDAFVQPKPYASWVLNTERCVWQPPIPYPDDGKQYIWNEETLSWLEVETTTND